MMLDALASTKSTNQKSEKRGFLQNWLVQRELDGHKADAVTDALGGACLYVGGIGGGLIGMTVAQVVWPTPVFELAGIAGGGYLGLKFGATAAWQIMLVPVFADSRRIDVILANGHIKNNKEARTVRESFLNAVTEARTDLELAFPASSNLPTNGQFKTINRGLLRQRFEENCEQAERIIDLVAKDGRKPKRATAWRRQLSALSQAPAA